MTRYVFGALHAKKKRALSDNCMTKFNPAML